MFTAAHLAMLYIFYNACIIYITWHAATMIDPSLHESPSIFSTITCFIIESSSQATGVNLKSVSVWRLHWLSSRLVLPPQFNLAYLLLSTIIYVWTLTRHRECRQPFWWAFCSFNSNWLPRACIATCKIVLISASNGTYNFIYRCH